MFVVFEGIDGSGKTTISNRVAGALRASGRIVEHVREGGQYASPVAQALREFGRDVRHIDLVPYAEFLLYVARDVQLLEEVTRAALGRAEVVIADRFLYSAEVLASHGRGLPRGALRPVLAAAAGGLEPDLVLLIDVDPYLARSRRQAFKEPGLELRPPSRKNQGGVGMQRRFRAGYRELADRDPGRWLVIDNDQCLDRTVEQIVRVIEEARQIGTKAALVRERRSRVVPRDRRPPVEQPLQALSRFVAFIERRLEVEPAVAAFMVGGLFGRGIDELRRKLFSLAPEIVVAGSSRLVDPVSWQLRESALAQHAAVVARSLAGAAGLDPRGIALRARLVQVAPVAVLSTFDGVDSDEAWLLREKLYSGAADEVVESVARVRGPRAADLRERWLRDRGGAAGLREYAVARRLGRAITGIDDEAAWQWREQLLSVAPMAALASVTHLSSIRAWQWRERFLERAPKVVFETLIRDDDDRAWAMRQKKAALVKEAIDSMRELDGPIAWRLRDQCLDVWPSTVVKSLGALADTPAGRKLTDRALRRHPDNLSLLKHAAAIALHAQGDVASVSRAAATPMSASVQGWGAR